MLIKYGGNIDVQNVDGETPLHLASQEGKTETAEMLVTHGANINIQDNVRILN